MLNREVWKIYSNVNYFWLVGGGGSVWGGFFIFWDKMFLVKLYDFFVVKYYFNIRLFFFY